MAAQMVRRRVYTDDGELIRSDLAPKDLANDRATLMRYWAEQDRIQAEQEAADAAAAVAAVDEVSVLSPADLIAPLADELAALAPRVAQLEQSLDGLTAATPEEIARVGVLLTSASTAAMAVEGAALRAMEDITAERDAVVAIGEAVQGEQARVAGEIGQLLTDGRASLEQTEAEMLAKTTAAISKRITQFQVEAAQLRGPKGNTGRIGQGLIAGAGKRPDVRPDGHEWAPGDSWLNTKAEGFQLEYMAADGSWSKPARLVPAPKLLNATQHVIDQAPRNTLVQTISAGGGGGGGGGEPLLSNRAMLSASTLIADTSNWVGSNSDPTSGQAVIEITALDGTLAGRKGFVCIDFLWEPSGAKETQAALLGDLNGSFDVNLSYTRSPASVPSGVTASLPVSANALRVFLTVVPTPGSSGSGGVTQFRLGGDIEWAHQSLGRAVDRNTAGIQPLWRWI